MQIELTTGSQELFTWGLDGNGTNIKNNAAGVPDAASVLNVKNWLLGLSTELTIWCQGVAGDNGYTLRINVTQPEYDARLPSGCVAFVVNDNIAFPTIPALTVTALQTIQNAF